jgi:hypothetical protein
MLPFVNHLTGVAVRLSLVSTPNVPTTFTPLDNARTGRPD